VTSVGTMLVGEDQIRSGYAAAILVTGAVLGLTLLVWPGTDSSGAAQPVPFEFPDPGVALALAFDGAGLPIVVYSTGNLGESESKAHLARCADLVCTSATSVSEVPDLGAQLFVTADDRVVFAKAHAETGVVLHACVDHPCTSIESVPIAPEAGRMRITELVVLGESGRFVVAGTAGDHEEQVAVFVFCDVPECLNPVVSSVPGELTDAAADPDDRLAFILDDKLVRCLDATCSDHATGVLPAPGGFLAFGATGMPMVVVAYETQPFDAFPTEWNALLMHCDDDVCADERSHAVPIIEGNAESRVWFGEPTSLHLGPYGIPIYGKRWDTGFDNDGRSLRSYRSVGQCAAVHCTAPPKLNSLRLDSDPPTYFAVAPNGTMILFSGRGNYPVGTYSETPPPLRLVACGTGYECPAHTGFGDTDGDGVPDWAELACANELVTVEIGAGDQPTPADDVIAGTSGPDVIAAGDGDDVICGFGGDDRIWGQGGEDRVFGGEGVDRLRGGDGADLLRGGTGNDDVAGGRGDDRVEGDDGDDVVRGGTGDDLVRGGPGHDQIAGNGGADYLEGDDRSDWDQHGDDVLVGGPRRDRLFGGAGSDVLSGNGGADSLYGGPGQDELYGGRGSDQLTGGFNASNVEREMDLCSGGDGDDTAEHCAVVELVP